MSKYLKTERQGTIWELNIWVFPILILKIRRSHLIRQQKSNENINNDSGEFLNSESTDHQAGTLTITPKW